MLGQEWCSIIIKYRDSIYLFILITEKSSRTTGIRFETLWIIGLPFPPGWRSGIPENNQEIGMTERRTELNNNNKKRDEIYKAFSFALSRRKSLLEKCLCSSEKANFQESFPFSMELQHLQFGLVF